MSIVALPQEMHLPTFFDGIGPSLPQPALELTGSRVAYRDTEVRLTPFGETVLDGKASFLEANGIDDWVAGVHLQSTAGRVWLHARGNLRRR